MHRILLIFALFFSPTLSQQLIDNKNENPLEIYAEDAIEWHKNEKKYLALGNAKASSGSMSLTSDKIEAFYDEQDDSAMDIQLVKAHKSYNYRQKT